MHCCEAADALDGSPTEAELLAADGWRQRSLGAGETLWTQGAPADTLALVAEGCLRVVLDGREVQELRPGEMLGELSVLGTERSRTASVVAAEPTVLWELGRTTLEQMRSARSEGYQRVLQLVLPQLARRVDRTRMRLAPGATMPELDPAALPVPARLGSAEEALATVPGLSGLSPAGLAAIAARTELRRVDAGTTLVTQDGFADRLVVLASGKAEVAASGQPVAEFDAGTLIGADALLRSRSWRHTVRTSTPAQVLELRQADWWELPDAVRLEFSEVLLGVLREELLAANRAG